MKPIEVLVSLLDSVRLTEDEKEALARALELHDALSGRGNMEQAVLRALRAHDALSGGPSERAFMTYQWPTGIRPVPKEWNR